MTVFPRQALTEKVFGKLTVLKFIERIDRRNWWLCRCECGTEKRIMGQSLKAGCTTSCGCWNRIAIGLRVTTHGATKGRIRGQRISEEYALWSAMRQRCTNPNNRRFKDYGGRGITVCERWLKYENFLIDLGPRPSPKHSIERLDNNGNYGPDNCRWATAREQQRNMRTNRLLTFDGKTKCVAAWAEDLGMSSTCLSTRLRRGWSIERYLNHPVQYKRIALR
jgi:hypothetical protein